MAVRTLFLPGLTDMTMNKVIGALVIGLIACVFSFSPAYADTIDSFESDIYVTPKGVLDVNETITIDFGKVQRHGIYRFIPITYERGHGVYNTPLKLLDVTDRRG